MEKETFIPSRTPRIQTLHRKIESLKEDYQTAMMEFRAQQQNEECQKAIEAKYLEALPEEAVFTGGIQYVSFSLQ